MSITTSRQTELPTGTYGADRVHSSVAFEVAVHGHRHLRRHGHRLRRHARRRPSLRRRADRDARGQGREPARPPAVARVLRRRAAPRGLLLDRAGRRSTASSVRFEGEITIKGVTQPATLTGTIVGPQTDPYGNERYGLKLETTIDRTAFGITWNTDMPNGTKALSDEVTLKADLSLVKAA